jgi:hypothetical protein
MEIRNHSSKSISSFAAILVTPKTLDGFTFHESVGPWQTRAISEMQTIVPATGDPKLRLGRVTSCYVHLIDYSDGSSWAGPSPL